MVEITIRVNSDNIIGIKEDIAYYLEKYGDIQIVDIQEVTPKQEKLNTF